MRRTAPALGLAVAAAVGAATLAARHAHPAEVSPVEPHGGWSQVWLWGVVGGLALYALAMLAIRRGGSLRMALAIAGVVQLSTLAAPLLLSKDAYGYWATARVVTVHHANPYATPPAAYPDDPSLAFASTQWSKDTALYGPAFEVLALGPAAAAGQSAHDAELGYRVLALLGVLLALAIVARATQNAAAVALLGWNPLVALHFGGGGHSDGWLVAGLVVAVAARTRAAGGVAWPLATAVKAVPAILFPLDLIADHGRRPRRFWFGLIVATALVIGISGAVWGVHWLTASAVGVHATAPLGGVHLLGEAGLRHRYAVAVGALVFAAIYAVLLVRAWRNRRAEMSLALTALCLTTSLVRPWYAIWPLGLAAIEEDERAAVAAVALCAYFLLGDAVRF